uniref:Uncharacterized protein n=1 Tax=Arundo donax TaxID=35708 RepID=A0A0A9D8J6_ARUDO
MGTAQPVKSHRWHQLHQSPNPYHPTSVLISHPKHPVPPIRDQRHYLRTKRPRLRHHRRQGLPTYRHSKSGPLNRPNLTLPTPRRRRLCPRNPDLPAPPRHHQC